MNIESLRVPLFLGLLFSFKFLEIFIPVIKGHILTKKTLSNISLGMINSLVVSISFTYIINEVILFSEFKSFGLFHNINSPTWLKLLIIIIFFDFIIYWQHRIFHMSNFLWRFHKVHHSETHLEATSAIRFHPFEIFLSMILKAIGIIVIGSDLMSFVIFEAILSSMALFNHANLYLPGPLDKALRYIIVTPDMHRIHHSDKNFEMNSNYGFSLSVWDYLFKSFTNYNKTKIESTSIGLEDKREKDLISLLIYPFK